MPPSGLGPRDTRILVVAREEGLRTHLVHVLKDGNFETEQANGIAHARRIGLGDFALLVLAPAGLGPDGHVFVADAKAMMRTLLIAGTSDAARAASELLDPDDADELLARVADALRPIEGAELALALRFAQYCLNLTAHTLTTESGAEIPLTRGEFCLLQAFLQRPGRVLARDQLLGAVAGRDAEAYDRSIDMLVSRLRRKVEPDPKHPKLIVTIPGSGYKFAARVQTTEVGPSSAFEDSMMRLQSTLVKRKPPPNLQPCELFSGKPPLAVLPFVNLGGDPTQRYFSDGLTDDIITELSRHPEPFIIARQSGFTFRDQAIEVNAFAFEPGGRYLLKGSAHCSTGHVRVNAQLIDADAGACIWAERYDRVVEDVLSTQDEITALVAAAISPVVAEAERRRAMRKRPENLNAWETYQRGLSHMGKFGAADNEQAIRFFRHAITLNATFAPAYSALALAYLFEGSQFAVRPLDDAIKAATLWAHEAVACDPTDADPQAVLATATLWTGDRNAAWEQAVQAMSTDRNSPWALGVMAAIPLNNGYPATARNLLLTAMRRSPRDPHNSSFLRYLAMSYYFEQDYGRAAGTAKRALAIYPDNPMLCRWLAASLGQLGIIEEAREALRKAVSVAPGCFDTYVCNRPLWFRPEDHDLMLDGLRKAGWCG